MAKWGDGSFIDQDLHPFRHAIKVMHLEMSARTCRREFKNFEFLWQTVSLVVRDGDLGWMPVRLINPQDRSTILSLMSKMQKAMQ